MSSLNGDKSRFNRERKQKIARRKRNRGLLTLPAAKNKKADAASRAQPNPVSA